MPVVRTDGRARGRSVYGHVITKFSRMGSLPHFLTHSASLRALRARELHYNLLALHQDVSFKGSSYKVLLSKITSLCQYYQQKK